MLSKPLCTFKIPSLHDGLELDGRLYFPKLQSDTKLVPLKGFAIFAHPYAPLGGSWDDPVVQTVGALLLKKGFVLNTFNFRGARGVPGRTSWTGKPELGDYVSFYTLLTALMNALRDEVYELIAVNLPKRPLLVLGGYSYGSHIARHLPPHDVIHNMLADRSKGSLLHDLRARAHELAKSLAGYLELHGLRGRTELHHDNPSSPTKSMREVVVGGYESSPSGRRSSRDSQRRSIDVERVRKSLEKVKSRMSLSGRANSQSSTSDIFEPVKINMVYAPRIAHILVSPLLPPVSGLTTMFSELKFDHKIVKDAGSQSEASFDVDEMLTRNPTCVVFGSNDKFTSSKKLRKWATELRVRTASAFIAHEIQDAGHFWIEAGAEAGLLNAISSWIAGLVESTSA